MTAATVELYGLKNCDSTRRAQRWFESKQVAYRFHDIRDDESTGRALTLIAAEADWQPFLNRRSTTWRALPDGDKLDLDRPAALRLLAAQPTLIKRPLLHIGGVTLAGFDAARVAELVS
jgi:arsenate reductase